MKIPRKKLDRPEVYEYKAPVVEPKPIIEPPKVDLRPGCLTCAFWLDHKCHRFPPVIKAIGDSDFPSSAPSEWCGEWKGK